MEVARKFYGKFLPALGFVHESPGDDFHTFYAGGAHEILTKLGVKLLCESWSRNADWPRSFMNDWLYGSMLSCQKSG
jgi:hypothetical protein